MSRPHRGSLPIIFLVVFIDLLGFGIVLPLLARYGRHFEATGAQLGLLMASFSAMQFVFAPIWGRASDRVGRRPILLLGLLGSVVFYTLFGYVTSCDPNQTLLGLSPLAWLFITRCGAGIAGATIPTAQAYIADSTDGANRGKGMALIGAAFGLGFTFGPLLAISFANDELHAPPSPMAGYLAGGISLIALVWASLKLPESLPKEKRRAASPRKRSLFNAGTLKRVITNPVHRATILVMFLSTISFAQLEGTLSLVTEKLGLSERNNFYVFAYLGFMMLLFQGMIVRRLLPKLGEKKMAVGGGIMLAVGLGLVGYAAQAATTIQSDAAANQKSLWTLFILLPISVAGFSALNPALQSLLSRHTSEQEQGEVLGIGQGMSALARIIGPGVGIPMLMNMSVQAPYWLATALMVVAAVLIGMLKSDPPASFEAASARK